jgi:hypothetical protein
MGDAGVEPPRERDRRARRHPGADGRSFSSLVEVEEDRACRRPSHMREIFLFLGGIESSQYVA